MASPPDYDKEPKAPDKKANNIHIEDLKSMSDSAGDQLPESDSKSHYNVANTDAENKHVETLDDGQLRALLDEAITYKCPKDREGKSSLFKELLEEVELDEQACEAAARELTGSRGRRAGKGRRALPHSNSLQDLVLALAAEPAPRRRAAAPPAQVSARAIHGGSLPSGVDTSFLLSEEPTRGGYLATVRCVNPPPLSERRVSIDSSRSDNESRRSKPAAAGVTYTARATLEIAAPSSQAKLMMALSSKNRGGDEAREVNIEPRGPHRRPRTRPTENKETAQQRSLSTSIPTSDRQKNKINKKKSAKFSSLEESPKLNLVTDKKIKKINKKNTKSNFDNKSDELNANIHNWYKGLANYSKKDTLLDLGPVNGPNPPGAQTENVEKQPIKYYNEEIPANSKHGQISTASNDIVYHTSEAPDCYDYKLDPLQYSVDNWNEDLTEYTSMLSKIKGTGKVKQDDPANQTNKTSGLSSIHIYNAKPIHAENLLYRKPEFALSEQKQNKIFQNEVLQDCADEGLRQKYRERVGELKAPKLSDFNPRNIKKMTIGKPMTKNTMSNKKCSKENNLKDISNLKKSEIGKVPVSNNFKTSFNVISKVDENYDKETRDIKQNDDIKNVVKDIEMINMPRVQNNNNLFSQFHADQLKLINALQENDEQSAKSSEKEQTIMNDIVKTETIINMEEPDYSQIIDITEKTSNICVDKCRENELFNFPISTTLETETTDFDNNAIANNDVENVLNGNASSLEVKTETKTEHYILAELSNDSYIFLTLPNRLPTPNQDKVTTPKIENNNIKPYAPGDKIKPRKKKAKQCVAANKNTVINKDVLRELLFENVFKNTPSTSSKAGLTTVKENEVDSAIPFSCITTPEVVSSCNTTTATAPSANIVDSKPRGAGGVNGAARPAGSPPDDCKKSLDENGNSVQGYGTLLSGSSQHKKPRRKKSSKNEIVIKSHQIDGYQGNKDLNEVLRFIESHASRPKLRKHRDDADEKKSRNSRRKDKEGGGAPRAASLEEVSRTTLEELTCPAGEPAADAEPDAEFTTVTKRRARRRREPPPAAAPRSDRSDRSADSPDERYAVPDLISSCREYPALPPPPPRRRAAAPDVVCDRRAPPPVVLRPRRAEPGEARVLRTLTFGFELNETLLAPPPPPPPACDPRLLDRLVSYVAHAWEDVIKCGNGKVRYFSE